MMQPARHGLPGSDAQDVADLVILTHNATTHARLANAAGTIGFRIKVCELRSLEQAAFANELAGARGVLIHLPDTNDHRDDVLRLAAKLADSNAALAVLHDGDRQDRTLDSLSNLPPSTLRRLRALIESDRANAATALLSQFALAAGLSAEPSK